MPLTMPVSQTVDQLDDALSITVNQIVSDLKRTGEDVITLSLGEAYFDMPLFDFGALDAAKVNHYSDTKGLPELREKIAGYYRGRYGAPVSSEEIVVTAGSKAAIFLAALATLDAGDEALIHEPAWLSYPAHVRLARGAPRFIPHDVPVERFESFFTRKTRLLILCNPNNPSGRVYTPQELAHGYALCRERDCTLLIDEAYSDFTVEPFTSAATLAPDKRGLVIANSLSKNMGMSGWRIGYAIAEPAMALALEKLNQHVVTCAPTILCHYMAHYFDAVLARSLPQVAQVMAKRERIGRMLDELKIGRLDGPATFYFLIDLEDFPGSSVDFALELLLSDKVSVVPGVAYGRSVDRFVRLSFGVEPDGRIRRGLLAIRRLLDDRSYRPEATQARFARSGLAKALARNLLDQEQALAPSG